MTPPNPSDLSTLKNRGAKMMVYHGTSDPIFSSDDTTTWYDSLRAANGGDAPNFARFYRVPGMTTARPARPPTSSTCSRRWSTGSRRAWRPTACVATARGPGNAGGVNADVPADLGGQPRPRPLCPYPKVARYNGSGNIELAASFICQ